MPCLRRAWVIYPSQPDGDPVFMLSYILVKKDSKQINKYLVWQVVVNLRKVVIRAAYKALFLRS